MFRIKNNAGSTWLGIGVEITIRTEGLRVHLPMFTARRCAVRNRMELTEFIYVTTTDRNKVHPDDEVRSFYRNLLAEIKRENGKYYLRAPKHHRRILADIIDQESGSDYRSQ